MKRSVATILAMSAALGVAMPGLGGASRERRCEGSLTDSDERDIEAAKAKRERKAAKRAAQNGGHDGR